LEYHGEGQERETLQQTGKIEIYVLKCQFKFVIREEGSWSLKRSTKFFLPSRRL
jgi:hypothetical protein